jgi:Na+-translocating ferredoxin:NAD+ oxidoreductase RnfG subunit
MMRLRTLWILLVVLVASASSAAAQDRLQPAEALALAYPKATIERSSVTLDKKQRAAAEEAAGHKLPSARVRAYRAMVGEQCVGTAYFDTRKVRSKAQTLMIALDAEGKVLRLEVLRFDEPREYRAPAKWMAQFPGKSLQDALKIKSDIRNLTGATLTARATLDAVREVLAVHQTLNPCKADKDASKQKTEKTPAKKVTKKPAKRTQDKPKDAQA